MIRERLSALVTNVPIALTALRTNLMRSILTTLGVMIGVLAVILAVAIGEGAKVSISDSINSLGSNMAIISPQPESRGGRRTTDRGRLTDRDAQAIARLVPGVSAIAPQLRNTAQVVIGGRNTTTAVIGSTPGYGVVSNLDVETGRFITDADVSSGARVVVLGPTVVTKLFGSFDPIGQEVRVNRVPMKVIGILQSKGSSFGNDNDDMALIPLTTARQRFATSAPQGPDDLQVLFVGFEEGNNLGTAKSRIRTLLRDRNNVGEGEVDPFSIRTTEEFMEETGQVTGILQAVLVGIASISLLVGGIGIMNIMLVSVTERTREIGLRMAMGARRRDIRNQFLVEAAVLCTIGGAIGLALAAILGRVIANLGEFPVPVGLGTAAMAILFSAVIGLLFGSYPAIRASRLSPIEALRSE
jgi:putative ABC transport system permease protein